MIGVVIPSYGRRELLEQTLPKILDGLNRGVLLLAVSREEDIPSIQSEKLQIVRSQKGSTFQRNAALKKIYTELPSVKIIQFLDDDVVLCANFFDHLETLHKHNPSVTGFACTVVKDGATDGSIPFEEASQIANAHTVPENYHFIARGDAYGGFSLNRKLVGDLFFDERLCEYAFMEDWDLFARARFHGPTGHAPCCCLVHLATTSGRCNSRKLGYAQIMNPLYLSRKGVLPTKALYSQIAKFFAARLARFYRAEARQRLYGGVLALRDFTFFGPVPERVAKV